MAIPLGLNPLLLLTIDLMTELAPAISLAFEDPEASIMLRKPRDAQKDRLTSFGVLFYACLTAGVIEAFVKIINFRVVLWLISLFSADMGSPCHNWEDRLSLISSLEPQK